MVQAAHRTTQKRLIFLPGASGDGHFWARVADRLDYPGEKILLDCAGAIKLD